MHRCESPAFILTASRSGSTLLRFILDSHPELACPPETNVGQTAANLVRTWNLLENAGADTTAADVPAPRILQAARAAIDEVFDRYLDRRGKARWCDKSLDSHLHAELLAQLYPGARFICLYRHCMDVIASGLEASPWGLDQFGFDSFAAQHPGNSVAAIGHYWVACTRTIMVFEQTHPELCHRVRYEDMVTDPERTAAAIFGFLGVEQVPGLTQACFGMKHEANGPGDLKIWFTSEVTAASIGSGVRVPADALPPPLRGDINRALVELGYRRVDAGWNAVVGACDPRASTAPAPAADSRAHPELEAVESAIAGRIGRHALAREHIARQWPGLAGRRVVLYIEADGGAHREMQLTLGDGPPAADPAPAARIIASTATWRALLAGESNMITEKLAGRIRCVTYRETDRIRSDELHAVAAMLGLARIPVARDLATSHDPALTSRSLIIALSRIVWGRRRRRESAAFTFDKASPCLLPFGHAGGARLRSARPRAPNAEARSTRPPVTARGWLDDAHRGLSVAGEVGADEPGRDENERQPEQDHAENLGGLRGHPDVEGEPASLRRAARRPRDVLDVRGGGRDDDVVRGYYRQHTGHVPGRHRRIDWSGDRRAAEHRLTARGRRRVGGGRLCLAAGRRRAGMRARRCSGWGGAGNSDLLSRGRAGGHRGSSSRVCRRDERNGPRCRRRRDCELSVQHIERRSQRGGQVPQRADRDTVAARARGGEAGA
jgi:Sulfotransferase family